MTTHRFLSNDWIEACRKLREEYASKASSKLPALKLNLVVIDVPFEPHTIHAHFDTTNGTTEIDLGHLPGVTLSATIDYETAKTILIEGKLSAAMQGLQSGRIKINGNMFQLMKLASIQDDPTAKELAERIREITE